MPGHKRNLESTPLKGAFRCDITEIDDFDNLHNAEGIILEAEKRAAELFGAEKSFFLVNGSTSGVLSAISAAVSENGTVLAARGSHRSFYNAAYLRHLDIEYLPVKMIPEFGIFDGYSGENVEEALEKSEKKIEAVFITTPTYEGICSDVKAISEVCHKRGIPLIVDAAHGAHFGLAKDIPDSAVHQGADIVINSLHKTLPAMTQTAIIHIQGSLVDASRLKRFLSIYQSSSPSYVLMSSIDLCIKEMRERGDEFAGNLLRYRAMIQDAASDLKKIAIPGKEIIQDPAKVLISTENCYMTGQQLYVILREEYSLQLEMAGESYALAIITGWDTEEGIKRLITALKEIDRGLDKAEMSQELSEHLPDVCLAEDNLLQPGKKKNQNTEQAELSIPQKALLLHEAWDMEKESVPLCECEGRIAGEFVNLYPPGIPLIVPGEVIGKRFLESISRYMAKDLNLQGVFQVKNGENKGIIGKRGLICVKQK